MKKIIVITILFILCSYSLASAATVNQLRAQYRNDPHGLSQWMRCNLRYSSVNGKAHQRPEVTLRRGKSDCEDFAILAQAVLGKGRLVHEEHKGTGHVVLIFWRGGTKYVFSNQNLHLAVNYKFGKKKAKFVPKLSGKSNKQIADTAEIRELKRELKRLTDDVFNAGYYQDKRMKSLKTRINMLKRCS